MRTYLIRGDQITVHSATPKSVSDDALVVRRINDLDSEYFPIARLVSLWNLLPDVAPLKRFKNRADGIKRLWNTLGKLPLSDEGRATSKQSRLIILLRRTKGASMEELMSATGWQSHSVRGVLSGVLRKKLGLAVALVKTGNTRAYRIDGTA